MSQKVGHVPDCRTCPSMSYVLGHSLMILPQVRSLGSITLLSMVYTQPAGSVDCQEADTPDPGAV